MTYHVTALAAALALTGSAAAAQEVTLRLHQFLPETSAVPANILQDWIDGVEEASDGRIEVQHFPSMQLGGTPPELVDQVQDGVADIIWTLPGYTPGRFPSLEVMELPFFVEDAGPASRALWRLAEERGLFESELAGMKVLGLWVHGPGTIHADAAVHEPADLEGLSMRAPTRTVTTLLSTLGANAVGMPVPSVPEAVQRGVIDGAVIPWEVTTSIHMAELVDHHTEFEGPYLYAATFLFAMNEGAYDALPEDLQAVIDAHSGLDFSGEAGATQLALDAPGRELAVEAGNEIHTVSGEELAQWHEAAAPVVEDWVAQMDDAGRDGAGLLEDARRLIADETGE
ncbi:TRAP transporter substrate-binding protein [Pseudoroseicyclus tamaricis]|uniref:TRAP transporter substrate-binding protein n=1 Tax=Pseudoroseicyclus tamaricis TaxID=2705421 RepID=A0A6B2JZC3_9RHOB|nr:TRAP transporter substrate-binding protein [Pseudoroseicyclus tamaricis]NDV00722.1 TRAP transporter substrate-binding protein [Pseudoroseicyclus tamaricis]